MLTKIHTPSSGPRLFSSPPGVDGPLMHVGELTYRGVLLGRWPFEVIKSTVRVDLFKAFKGSAVWFDCVYQPTNTIELHKWAVVNENMQLMHYFPEYREVPLEDLPATILVMGLLDGYFRHRTLVYKVELVSCRNIDELGHNEYKRRRGMPV